MLTKTAHMLSLSYQKGSFKQRKKGRVGPGPHHERLNTKKNWEKSTFILILPFYLIWNPDHNLHSRRTHSIATTMWQGGERLRIQNGWRSMKPSTSLEWGDINERHRFSSNIHRMQSWTCITYYLLLISRATKRSHPRIRLWRIRWRSLLHCITHIPPAPELVFAVRTLMCRTHERNLIESWCH